MVRVIRVTLQIVGLALGFLIFLEAAGRWLYFTDPARPVLTSGTGYFLYRVRTAVQDGTSELRLALGQTDPRNLSGNSLHERAWNEVFRERNHTPPPDGPREGYWGSKLGREGLLGSRNAYLPEVKIPGKVEIDGRGFQTVRSTAVKPRNARPFRLLIIGGSVAFGAYASAENITYFHLLSGILAERGWSNEIRVLAGGGWTSDHELMAFLERGRFEESDLVLFLDGVNDLSNRGDQPFKLREEKYLANVTSLLTLAQIFGKKAAFAIQPSIVAKPVHSAIETEILRRYAEAPTFMQGLKERLIPGVQERVRQHGSFIIDCSESFSREKATLFVDLWHFPDPGHRLLAMCLVDGLGKQLEASAR